MVPNPNSYALGSLVGLFPMDASDHSIGMRVDTDRQKFRFRLPIADARELAAHLAAQVADYDRVCVQSPISSGMGNSDGSPVEGQSV